ncbi:MAG: hypothetical protein ACOX9B_05955 [Candidatus Xenobium sp.]|jgi:hypothetical protein|nr:hypothetical protein [Burkholderiales bacterium]
MKRGIYQYEGTPGEVIARLESAQQEDRKAERQGRIFGSIAWILFFLGVGLLAYSSDVSWLVWPGVSCLVGAVLCIPFLVRADSQNLVDFHYLEPLRFLRVLQADLPPDRPIRLKVDFRDYPMRAFQVSCNSEGRGRTRLTYQQPWMEFRGRLADGSRLSLEVVRKAERLKYRKTSGSKTKYRWKEKVVDRISLRLQVPGLDLGNLESQHLPRLPHGMIRRDLKTQGDTVRMVVQTPRARRSIHRILAAQDLANGDRLLALLLWVYKGVGRLRSPNQGRLRQAQPPKAFVKAPPARPPSSVPKA